MKKRVVFILWVILSLGVMFGVTAFGRELTINRDEFRNIPVMTLRPLPSIISLPRVVILPTLPPVPTIKPLATTIVSTKYQIPVLVLKYFPLDSSDHSKLDRNIIGGDLGDINLTSTRQKVARLNTDLMNALEMGGKVFDYRIFFEKEFLKEVPIEMGGGSRPADHVKMLTGSGFNICNYVENFGVKEVWVWMYHSNVAYPVESYQVGPFGGIGNGYMNLPVCKKTYTVYDYNYGRGLGEALEDHSHHIEILFRAANSDIFNKFVGGSTAPFACGWVHCPPNVMNDCNNHQYDWKNETVVQSTCTGSLTNVSCHTWDGASCTDNGGVNFKVWWMQNVPSKWWVWIGDYDKARGAGLGLQ